MSINDPISDTLTRIRNGMASRKSFVMAPCSKMVLAVLDVLKREGYIRNHEVVEVRTNIKEIKIELKYHEGLPVIREINRISKPGRRVYSAIGDMKVVLTGLGISILSPNT